jgi:hypothetical protein
MCQLLIARSSVGTNPAGSPQNNRMGSLDSGPCHSESDIAGLGGSGSATAPSSAAVSAECQRGNAALADARVLRQQSPRLAQQAYKRAADTYRHTGDPVGAATALQEAAALVAALANNAPSSAGPAGQPAAPQQQTAAPVVASAPNLPRNESGASGEPPAPASTPPVPPLPDPNPNGTHWHGTSVPADCDKANSVERSSAYWGYMCVHWQGTGDPDDCYNAHPDGRATAAWKQKCARTAYVPPISPQDLTARAYTACNDVTARRCIDDAKVRILLADDPDVRAACASISAPDDQIACVDAVYLFGPGAPWTGGLSDKLRKSLGAASVGAPPEQSGIPAQIGDLSQPPEKLVPDVCAPGYGLKPAPAPAFGGRTCQRLGVIYLAPDKQAGSAQAAGSTDAPDPAEAFEKRVNDVAILVVAGIADRAGAQLSAEDRKTCMGVAYEAARSMLNGGVPPVPAMCRAMVNAALGELAYYADAHIDPLNPGVEELLAYLNMRDPKSGGSTGGNLGPPPPGMTGIEPSPEDRRYADCIARGGTRESCADAAAPPKPAQVPAAAVDCAQAETHWKSVEQIEILAAYQDHLARFPNCAFATLAKARIDALRK